MFREWSYHAIILRISATIHVSTPSYSSVNTSNRVIPCQINKEIRIISWILMKHGVFVVPMVFITCTNL